MLTPAYGQHPMFGKIFESMFTGSLMGAGPVRMALWAYAIAHAKPPEGLLEINPRLAAVQIGCEPSDIYEALEFFQSPDPESRSREEDGRRLVHVDGFTYRMVNHAFYRAIRDKETRREQNRRAQANFRNSKQSKPRKPKSAQAEAEAEAEAEVQNSAVAEPAPDGFAEFWAAYQKATKKPKALSAWKRLTKADRSAAMAGVPAYVAATPDKQFRRDAVTWLNQRGWEDEIVVPTSQPLGANGRPAARTSMTHIPNMPLGHDTCQCDGCVSYRAKRGATA